MSFDKMPKSLQDKIMAQAKRSGVTVDEVIEQLDAITSGKAPKKLGILR